MRVVLVGASELGVLAARMLIAAGHEVVVVEADRERIDGVYDDLDCSFLHGDGTKPAVLREARPEETQVLICVTHHDEANVLASLVGRSLGFRRVVTTIEDPELEPVCRELGLEDTLVPPREMALHLKNLVEGAPSVEMSTFFRGDARLFLFIARDEHAGTKLSSLGLPKRSRAVCVYREDEFLLAADDVVLEVGDEVVIAVHAEDLDTLTARLQPALPEQQESEN